MDFCFLISFEFLLNLQPALGIKSEPDERSSLSLSPDLFWGGRLVSLPSRTTGIEPAAFDVTGQYSDQLSYVLRQRQ